ncbi:MAG TPA: hypothetical protein VMB80_05050 [Candidatus Acidoferrum sp.]|nr:hypothetical protein [Candidatus Acidoferrum sp.]
MALAALLTGCVASSYRMTLALEPSVQDPLRGVPKASVALGRFRDSRTDAAWYVLLYKPNAPNFLKPTELAWLKTNSVAGVLRDGAAEALGQNGFKTIGGPSDTFHNGLTAAIERSEFKADPVASYLLCGDIKSAGCRNIQRLFAHSIIKTWLTVRFDLVNQADRLTVWHDTYTGQTTMTNHSGGEFLAIAFAAASDDVMRQLVTDRTFRSYFEP